MDNDHVIAVRLRRLDVHSGAAAPFDYDGLMERQARRVARGRRLRRIARGTAGALVVAFVGASVWRLEPTEVAAPVVESASLAGEPGAASPRIVRADTYLALAALEDHIARVDDAISVARMYAPRGAEVARLERTRNELLDSYAQVRYAELVSANF